jgi:methionyl-tRNA formyltransferase
VFQPESVNESEFIDFAKTLEPHFLVLVAFDEKLSSEVLNIPLKSSINLHPSLLPDLRGACPVQWALIYGYDKTGITTIKMNEDFDAGDILYQEVVEINDTDSAGTLHDRLAERGAMLLDITIRDCFNDRLNPIPQEEGNFKKAPKIKKSDRVINWNLSANKLNNYIRGLTPYPGAFSYLDNKRICFREVGIFSEEDRGNPGEVVDIVEDGIVVGTGDGLIIIRRLIPEGSSEMDGCDFYNGGGVEIGDVFKSREQVFKKIEVDEDKKDEKEKRGLIKRFWKNIWNR